MVRANALQKVAAHDDGVWAVAWVPGKPQLLTGSVDETAKLWSTADDKLDCLHTYAGQALGVVSLDVDASGTSAVSSSMDSMVRVFGTEEQRAIKHLVERQPTEAWGVAFGASTPESTQLGVAGGSTGRAYTYRGGAEEPALELTLDLPAADAAPAAAAAAGGSSNPAAAAAAAAAAKKERFVLSVAFSPDKRLLAAGASDGTVAVWDLGSGGQLLHVGGLKGHHKPVRALTFTPDSKLLLTACDDMHSNLYDVHQGALVDAFSGHESWVLDVAVHPSGEVFATSSSDARVKLWELSSRSLVQTLAEHSDQVWGCAFSSDGARLASVGDDKQLVMYAVA